MVKGLNTPTENTLSRENRFHSISKDKKLSIKDYIK